MVAVDRLTPLLFFEGLPPEALAALAGVTVEVKRGTGEYVVRQHTEARHVYFLLEGAVAFLLRFEGVDDFLVGASQTSGILIGWSAFRPPYRYTASVRCEAPCRLLEVPREALEALVRSDPQVGYEILRRVMKAVANRLEQARDLLVAEPDHLPPEGASY